ncbi:MAG: 7-carboxy-7-deazaguanine synthase QueE [Dehalococcoidia bacterium]|nr:7-carboxy-7-deazaguanine synthase QueE [Dehalococcoidia bacterium]
MTALLLARLPSGEPEVFASIQGEGVSAGLPSTFLRLAVCNLRCRWCDTAYTWDWRRYDRTRQVLALAPEAVAARVLALAPRNAVVTGGEPLLQRRQLAPLLKTLRENGFRVEVETNGTVSPDELAPLVDQWNVSPKLRHSGNEGLRRLRPEVLAAFAALPGGWFKFVVAEEADLDEVEALRREVGLPADRVVLMPEGRTRALLEGRGAWLAEACAARGYRFTTRLHILLWGDERGR